MASPNRLQQYFFGKQLRDNNSYSKTGQLKSVVSSALFLLPPQHREEASKVTSWCKQNDIGDRELDILRFSDGKVTGEDVVGKQQMTWYMGLKSHLLQELKSRQYDLLVNLDDGYNRPMLVATAAVQADFKVGFLANSIKVYHLLLEDHGSSLTSKLNAMEQVFQMIDKK